jgi:hypothetical protein
MGENEVGKEFPNDIDSILISDEDSYLNKEYDIYTLGNVTESVLNS